MCGVSILSGIVHDDLEEEGGYIVVIWYALYYQNKRKSEYISVSPLEQVILAFGFGVLSLSYIAFLVNKI